MNAPEITGFAETGEPSNYDLDTAGSRENPAADRVNFTPFQREELAAWCRYRSKGRLQVHGSWHKNAHQPGRPEV